MLLHRNYHDGKIDKLVYGYFVAGIICFALALFMLASSLTGAALLFMAVTMVMLFATRMNYEQQALLSGVCLLGFVLYFADVPLWCSNVVAVFVIFASLLLFGSRQR